MTQLLAHLVGDYVLQSHVMATRKVTSWTWAFVHAAFYTLPFLLLTQDWHALLVIGGTHAVIDRLRIARRWCEFYGVGLPGVWWRPCKCVCGHDLAAHMEAPLPVVGVAPPLWIGKDECGICTTCTGRKPEPFEPPPPFLGVWLVIIVDNTMHLAVNAWAVGYWP